MALRKESRVRSLPPATDIPERDYDEPIKVKALQAPVLTGTALKLFLPLIEGPLGGPIIRKLMRNNGLPQILEELYIPEEATFRPNTSGWRAEDDVAWDLALLVGIESRCSSGGLSAAQRAAAAAALSPAFAARSSSPRRGSSSSGEAAPTSPPVRHYTAADYRAAYQSGRINPSDVAENIIEAIAASEAQSPPMRFLVAHDPELLRQAAAASTQRWRSGRPLSPLDGVPFAVKDCMDALPYPTTAGTGFMADWRTPTASIAAVQALQDAGALLVGKATLHEIGLGTTGLNLLTGTARNPHSTAHHTCGSSSGSAAIVAAGLCPFALGSDGGGSIRIPAAACGVAGLKPTHERVGTAWGVAPIDHTVSVIGPLAGSVLDLALMYAVVANTGQHEGVGAPPVLLPSSLDGSAGCDQSLAGKTAGICWKWFDDAAPAVAHACNAAVSLLEAKGLKVVEIQMPELALLRAAHSCTISSEMRNNMLAALQDPASRKRMNNETRVSLAVASGFEAAHYLNAQKIRTRIERHFRRAFEHCDVIITPTLPCTAPPIKPAALVAGESDLATTTSLMHYMLAGNMLGLPAVSVPVGAVPSTHPRPAAGKKAAAAAGAAPAAASPGNTGGGSSSSAVLEAAVAAAGCGPQLPPVWFDTLAARPSE
ncbi:fatty acid amide hydrolase [Chlorella sorokiniana]|uniref:Fatty acid amide hydrolase n=1 Tax=Chlorella sorokiniana TaxID=3076 RepID=A0A2P6U0I9_CHLSO|nr:fatty acid amide hydrolase [Chlorella sorokiniana]|eukprot:PRW59826.1 fatty acid amide hydrolase [Chlorella sorokiniana]